MELFLSPELLLLLLCSSPIHAIRYHILTIKTHIKTNTPTTTLTTTTTTTTNNNNNKKNKNK